MPEILTFPMTQAWKTGNDATNNWDLAIEEQLGILEEAYDITSVFAPRTMLKPLIGTNKYSIDRMGNTTLNQTGPTKVDRQHDESTIQVDSKTGTLDTVIYSRMAVRELDTIQDRLNLIMEHGQVGGYEMADQFDQVVVSEMLKGAVVDYAGDDAPSGHIGGLHKDLAPATFLDADLLEKEMSILVAEQEMRKQKVHGQYWLMTPLTLRVLRDSNKLMSVEYSAGNGDFAGATLYKVAGFPIVTTRHMQMTETAGGTHELMSNDLNANKYDITAAMAKARVMLIGSNSIRGFKAIDFNSKIFWDDKDQVWYSHIKRAYAVDYSRPDNLGLLSEV